MILKRVAFLISLNETMVLCNYTAGLSGHEGYPERQKVAAVVQVLVLIISFQEDDLWPE